VISSDWHLFALAAAADQDHPKLSIGFILIAHNPHLFALAGATLDGEEFEQTF
jgi:hypothetical protein